MNREKHGRRNDLRRAYNQKKVTSMLFGGGKLTDVDQTFAMGYSSIEEANAFVRKYAAWEKQRKACKKAEESQATSAMRGGQEVPVGQGKRLPAREH